MLLVLSHPILDARRISEHTPTLLPAPHWPKPMSGEFVRGIGAINTFRRVRKPTLRGEHYFEEKYCLINRGLSIPPFTIRLQDGAYRLRPEFKRYVFDSSYYARYDSGFFIPPEFELGIENVGQLLHSVANAKVYVRIYQEDAQWVKLSQVKKHLCRQHNASTLTKYGEYPRYKGWVLPLTPLIIIETHVPDLRIDDTIAIGKKIELFKSVVEISMGEVEFNNLNYPKLIIIKSLQGEQSSVMRDLRVYLTRAYTEVMAMEQLLVFMQHHKEYYDQRLFLHDELSSVFKNHRRLIVTILKRFMATYGVDLEPILYALLTSEYSSTSKDNINRFIDEKHYRKQSYKMIERHFKQFPFPFNPDKMEETVKQYTYAPVTITDNKGAIQIQHGDHNVATINQTLANNDEFKKSYEEYLELYNDLMERLDEDKALDVSINNAAIENQLAQPEEKQNKTIIRKSFENIKNIAEYVFDNSHKIIPVIGKLIALFL